MPEPIVMPSYGMYTAEGTLVSWLKPNGTRVESGQIIAEIETEKAVQELPAPASGVLHQVAPVGARIKEQQLLGYVLAEGEAPPAEPNAAPAASLATTAVAGNGEPTTTAPDSTVAATRDTREIRASPIAKRLARENGIDLAAIRGTGPGGRIVEGDVIAAIERAGKQSPSSSSLPSS